MLAITHYGTTPRTYPILVFLVLFFIGYLTATFSDWIHVCLNFLNL
jgi:hypothetical protein